MIDYQIYYYNLHWNFPDKLNKNIFFRSFHSNTIRMGMEMEMDMLVSLHQLQRTACQFKCSRRVHHLHRPFHRSLNWTHHQRMAHDHHRCHANLHNRRHSNDRTWQTSSQQIRWQLWKRWANQSRKMISGWKSINVNDRRAQCHRRPIKRLQHPRTEVTMHPHCHNQWKSLIHSKSMSITWIHRNQHHLFYVSNRSKRTKATEAHKIITIITALPMRTLTTVNRIHHNNGFTVHFRRRRRSQIYRNHCHRLNWIQTARMIATFRSMFDRHSELFHQSQCHRWLMNQTVTNRPASQLWPSNPRSRSHKHRFIRAHNGKWRHRPYGNIIKCRHHHSHRRNHRSNSYNSNRHRLSHKLRMCQSMCGRSKSKTTLFRSKMLHRNRWQHRIKRSTVNPVDNIINQVKRSHRTNNQRQRLHRRRITTCLRGWCAEQTAKRFQNGLATWRHLSGHHSKMVVHQALSMEKWIISIIKQIMETKHRLMEAITMTWRTNMLKIR